MLQPDKQLQVFHRHCTHRINAKTNMQCQSTVLIFNLKHPIDIFYLFCHITLFFNLYLWTTTDILETKFTVNIVATPHIKLPTYINGRYQLSVCIFLYRNLWLIQTLKSRFGKGKIYCPQKVQTVVLTIFINLIKRP